VEYARGSFGLVCPRDTFDLFKSELQKIQAEGLALFLAENSKKDIIMYELGNYETQFSMDIDDAVIAVNGYGFTREDVQECWPEYWKMCIDNDWF